MTVMFATCRRVSLKTKTVENRIVSRPTPTSHHARLVGEGEQGAFAVKGCITSAELMT